MPPATITAEDLLLLDIPNKRMELVRGTLVVREPPGGQHGFVAANLCRALANYVEQHDLGAVFAGETGFKLFSDPDTVRAPDVAFVSSARLPNPIPVGYPAMAPDLAVEVLSPTDRPGEVLAKVADWLEAGCASVWVVDPARRAARTYRADGTQSEIGEREVLGGEGALAGFTCALTAIL